MLLDAVLVASMRVVVGPFFIDPLRRHGLGPPTTQNAASETTYPSREKRPTERQRGVQRASSLPTATDSETESATDSEAESATDSEAESETDSEAESETDLSLSRRLSH